MSRNNKTVVVSQSHYSGPLPPSTELQKYDDACPGAAERIIKMAEDEAEFRRKMQIREHNDSVSLSKWSMTCATISIIVLSCVIGFAVFKNSIISAVATSISAIAAVAGIFILRKKEK